MLFDYSFLAGLGLDWFVLGLVIFGMKTLNSSSMPQKKGIVRKWLFKIVILALILNFLLKIASAIVTALPLQSKIISTDQSFGLLYFISWQLLLAFIFLFFTILLLIKDGFEDDYKTLWSKRIASILIVSLFLDFFGSSVTYYFFLKNLLSEKIGNGLFYLKLMPLNPNYYWFVLGLLFAVIIYFIFYFSLKHKIKRHIITGFLLSYLIVLGFSLFTAILYQPLIVSNLGYLWNDLYLYLAVLIWVSILLAGIGCVTFLWLLFHSRKHLKNQFYFKYLFIHISNVHAISVLGLAGITLVPVLFFLYY